MSTRRNARKKAARAAETAHPEMNLDIPLDFSSMSSIGDWYEQQAEYAAGAAAKALKEYYGGTE